MQSKQTAATSHAAQEQYTLAHVADAFMASYDGRDPSIVARVAYWTRTLGERPLVEIGEDEIEAELHDLAKRPALAYHGGAKKGGNVAQLDRRRSPATINRYRAALASIIKWARTERLIPKRWESPIKHVDRRPEPIGRLRYLSKDEYQRLRQAARVSRWPRLWLFITLAVTTGARRGALEALKWADIDLEAGRAVIERTKNGTPHTLVLVPEVVAELRKFRHTGSDELVFRSRRSPDQAHIFDAVYQTACRQARIEGACVHTLRHTHASWLAQEGASLMQIAESMNHRTLSMVKRYAHLCVDDRARLVGKVFS